MIKPEPITEPKRRKMVQKTVIRVKIEENSGKQKGDGPPSDMWSWRKYGQKPIKGSPYPRGYYKCSTSKGCSAKKQVERCKTDASMLIVTYTSTHNHPGPDLLHATIPEETQAPAQPIAQDIQTNNPPNPPPTTNEHDCENTTTKCEHHQSPLKCSEKEDNKTQEDSSNMLCEDDGHLTCPQQMSSTPPPTSITTMQPSYDENDFFDELEELPISSSFTGLMVGCFFEERTLLPS